MNDRYLFKAKRTDNGKWVEGNLFDDGFENGRMFVGGLVIEEYHGTACDDWSITGINFYEVDPSTICQCTGLKDKNGKLIWANDIVKSFNGVGDECSISKIVFTEDYSLSLGWCKEGIRSLLKYDKRVFSVGFKERDAKKSEVIGNIFDNAELLEVMKNGL